jgi:hypothetical protein
VREGAVVTGVAWLFPEGAWPEGDWTLLPEVQREEVDPLREDARFLKLDRAARLLLLGARRALGGRNVSGERSGISLGTVTGSLEADRVFDATRRMAGGASPALFPLTLPTAPLAEVAQRLGLKGPALCVSAGNASLLAAVRAGVRAIERSDADLVVVAGLEVACSHARAVLGAGPFVESVLVLLLEREGNGPRVLPVSPAPLEVPAPWRGHGNLLGNQAAPDLIRAMAAVSRRRAQHRAVSPAAEPALVSVHDPEGPSAAVQVFHGAAPVG